MKKIIILLLACVCSASCVMAQSDSTLISSREDGRLQSTYAILHQMLRDTEPECAFKAGMDRQEFLRWQEKLQMGMKSIMKWPVVDSQPEPRLVSEQVCEGYVLQNWECYPFEKAVVPFMVMVPDGCKEGTPGILCIPGSGATMKSLTRGMALDYVREGWIAVCVDNACALAPRHLIFTEGGLDRDFCLVREAYRSAGVPEAVECHHQKKYQDEASRVDYKTLPEGLTRAEYFDMVNVDTKAHYFKRDLILPWLRRILTDD